MRIAKTEGRIFVDRENFRKAFPIYYSSYMKHRSENTMGDILYYYGDGGIGKSTLLKEFQNQLLEDKVPCQFEPFDFSIDALRNPLSFLIALRQAFPAIDFPLFDFAYNLYIQKAKLKPDSRMMTIKPFQALRDLIASLPKEGQDFIFDYKGALTKLKKIYSYLKQEIALRKYIDETKTIQRSSTEALEGRLVSYLAMDLENGMQHKMPEKGVVIFLDSFELVTSYAKGASDNALIQLILDEDNGLIRMTPSVLYVIASREKCDFGCLSQASAPAKNNGLDVWSEEDAVKFLTINSNGKLPEPFCHTLAKACEYYPMYLNVALDHIIYTLHWDYQKLDMNNLNKDAMLIEFLRGLDEAYTNTLAILVCQEDWDVKTYNKVLKKLYGTPTVALEEIRKYSFIKAAADKKDRIYLHHIMRDCIVDQTLQIDQGQRLRLIQERVHSILRDMYDYKKKKLTQKEMIHKSLGEEQFLKQYVRHAIWLIKNREQDRDQNYKRLFDELRDLVAELKDNGAAKILLSPLQQMADFAKWLYGENSEEYIACHYQMAFVYTYSGNLDLAEHEDERVYTAYKNRLEQELQKYSLSEDDLHRLRGLEDHMVRAHNSWAYDMSRNGKVPLAVEEGEVCAARAAQIWGEDDLKTIPSRSNLSYYLLKKGEETDRGIKMSEEVLAQREKWLKQIQSQVLISKRNLAVQYNRLSLDQEKALALMKESYDGFRNLLGNKNGQTLESRQYLANFLVRAGKYFDADFHLKKIYAVRKKQDGKNHPHVVDCLTYRALAHLGLSEKKGQAYLDSAMDHMEHAYRISQIIFLDDSKWKADMYHAVLEALRNGSDVQTLLFILDNYQKQ